MDEKKDVVVYASPPILPEKPQKKQPEICGAYAEYFPPGCQLTPGHKGEHRG